MKTYYLTLHYFSDQLIEPVVIIYVYLFIIYGHGLVSEIEMVMGKEPSYL